MSQNRTTKLQIPARCNCNKDKKIKIQQDEIKNLPMVSTFPVFFLLFLSLS
jgi:hypothetical protein